MIEAKTLLKEVQILFNEIENNGTLDWKWITWMKVAISYLLDSVYNYLFETRRLEQIIDEERTDEDYHNDFDCLIWYDRSDVVEKWFDKLNKYFISLQTK